MATFLGRFRGAAALTAAALLLSACGGAPANEPASAAPGTEALRVAYHIDLSGLDPLRGGAGPDVPILLTMYDTLVGYDTQTGEAQPGIAESWDQTKDSLTFHLRDGVTFHDGTPVDAEAVKFNIERGQEDFSTQSDGLKAIESVAVVDENTLKLELSKPDPSLPLVFADRAGMLVSPAAAKQNGNDFSAKAVGAGAYEFSDWKKGTTITVDRYAEYWNKDLTTAPQIVFNIITDGQTAANALVSGQQDLVNQVPVANVATLQTNSKLKVQSQPTTYVDQVYFNTSREGLSDARVRKALNLGIDRQTLVEAGYLGFGAPASSYYPSTHWAYPGDSLKYAYDTEQAKALLAAAGFADGFSFDLVAAPSRTRVAEILKQQWASIGVTANIITKETLAAGDGYFKEGKGDALLSYWGGRLDPDQTFTLMFAPGAFYNPGGSTVPGLDEALSKAATAADLGGRAAAFTEAASAVFEDAPNAPLSFTKVTSAMTSKVSGFQVSSVGPNRFVGVTVSK